MNRQYLLGFDVGSSSVKASLVNVDSGQCAASAFFPEKEAPIKAVQAGWAEQDPESWWQYAKQALEKVMQTTGAKGDDICAIGISYQMHGLVCVDKDLKPLRPAIIWCDSRAVPYGERAFCELGEELCLSHLLNSPGNFTAAKLAWVKENEPELFDKIYKVMLPGDYLALRLSGVANTTVSGLSEGMFWDFKENRVAQFLLDYYGIPSSFIPDIMPTFACQSIVSASAAQELGLKAGTPITYRAGDQPNNALSLNVFEPGEIAATAGTSGVVYGVLGEVNYDPKSRVNTFAHVDHLPTPNPSPREGGSDASSADKADSKTNQSPLPWGGVGGGCRLGVLLCINGTGILNAWMHRNVTFDMGYAEMNDLAEQAPIGSDGVCIMPFGTGAERVLQNKELGCSIHGLNFNKHSRAHLVRAAQEGIVFSFCYGMEVMQQMGMDIRKIHAGRANMFLSPLFRNTLAGVSGATIELFETDGSVGAAKGAGIGAGIYRDNTEAFASLERLAVIQPDAANVQAYAEAYARWKEVLAGQLK